METDIIFKSTTVAYSDSLSTLYAVHGRAKPVHREPNSTEPNLFHHGETAYTQWCKFMSKNSNFAREIRAEGGGELALAAQQKSARFHLLPDSEIYTTE